MPWRSSSNRRGITSAGLTGASVVSFEAMKGPRLVWDSVFLALYLSLVLLAIILFAVWGVSVLV
jgi:hypothetical protein